MSRTGRHNISGSDATGSSCRVRELVIEDVFLPHLEAAVARLAYLHPAALISPGPPLSITVGEGGNLDDIVRDFHFVLYRQKIYSETFAVRAAIVKGVMGR